MSHEILNELAAECDVETDPADLTTEELLDVYASTERMYGALLVFQAANDAANTTVTDGGHPTLGSRLRDAWGALCGRETATERSDSTESFAELAELTNQSADAVESRVETIQESLADRVATDRDPGRGFY